MGWGDFIKDSLLAASHVLKLGAAQFHQKPESCPSDLNKPTPHYWPKSYAAVLELSKGAPSFRTFANSQENPTRVPAGPKIGILRSVLEAKPLRALATASKPYHAVFEQNPKNILSPILTSDLADEVDEVPVSNPTPHTDFAVDLDAASESSISEGPAIITAVDLDIDSKNKPPSQEPANHTADQVVDHPLASSFAFGSGSLESPIKFSEGLGKVPDQGLSSLIFKSDNTGFWDPEETLVPLVPDIESKSSTTSPFNFGTKSGFSFDISTVPSLPSSRGVEKATGPLPFVFRGTSVPGYSLGVPEMLIASSSPATEITTRPSFQFGRNSTNDFKFDGLKVTTMPLAPASTPQSLDTSIPELAVSTEASMPNVISTRPRSTRSADSSTTRPIAIPKRRKVSTGADSGYGSGMSDKSISPPPPQLVKWSSQPKAESQTPGYLALRGVVATIVKDPTVEDVVDEYDEEISRSHSRIELEPAWDPAVPEDSDAMKRLKEEMTQEARKELDEPKKEREERKKEQQEQLKAVIGMKEDSRKKKGAKKVKKGNNSEKAGPNTPVDKATPATAVTEKASPKDKTQKCKSKGRARFRNGKCSQGLVEPSTVTGTI